MTFLQTDDNLEEKIRLRKREGVRLVHLSSKPNEVAISIAVIVFQSVISHHSKDP